MANIAEKIDTHIVIKKEDVLKYLEEPEQIVLEDMLNKIIRGRAKDKKKAVNHYYICNVDEPYAEMVHGIIYAAEIQKKNQARKLKI